MEGSKINKNPLPLMDDGELEFSTTNMDMATDIPCTGSMDSFFDELFKDTHACTHTHTCNPPGPDYTHTHTCFHVHTKLVPPSSEEKSGNNDDSAESEEKTSKKRATDRGGNREAVRKYRQKKKAHTASLEDEVVKLRTINQQLLKRLQCQSALEAEAARLKCLLVDIRGRIEGEIGSFPYQTPLKTRDIYPNITNSTFPASYLLNPCNVQCHDQIYCDRPRIAGEGALMNASGFSACEFEELNCMSNPVSAHKELLNCATATANETPIVPSFGIPRKDGVGEVVPMRGSTKLKYIGPNEIPFEN